MYGWYAVYIDALTLTLSSFVANYFPFIVAIHSEELLTVRDGQPTVEDIVASMLKECRKENIAYKMAALQHTATMLQSYDVDRMQDIADILLPLLPTAVCLAFSHLKHRLVGGMARWLGRRSLAGGVFSIFPWSVVEMWPQGVRYGSTNQANSAAHPFGVGKWIAVRVITWYTGMETIKCQTRAAYGCLVAGQSMWRRHQFHNMRHISVVKDFVARCGSLNRRQVDPIDPVFCSRLAVRLCIYLL